VPTIDEVRKNIILKDGIYYFDYTASGLAYAPIEDEISKFPTQTLTQTAAQAPC